jgi:hypothetical protein
MSPSSSQSTRAEGSPGVHILCFVPFSLEAAYIDLAIFVDLHL